MEELSDWMTSNNSVSLLIPLERVRDSTLYRTKAKKTLAIYQIKYRFAHSRENQAQKLQPPDCLVDQILPKTTGRVINKVTFSTRYYSPRKRCLLLNIRDAESNQPFFLAVLLKDRLVRSRTRIEREFAEDTVDLLREDNSNRSLALRSHVTSFL